MVMAAKICGHRIAASARSVKASTMALRLRTLKIVLRYMIACTEGEYIAQRQLHVNDPSSYDKRE